MPVSAVYAGNISVTETVADAFVSASDNTLTYTGLNKAATLNAATTATPATMHASGTVTMSAGAATLSLRALTGANGAVVDGNGLKVQMWKFKNPTTNANPVTVTFGAVNPYLLGGAAWKFTLSPGQEIQGFGNDATPDVGAASLGIDISGTLAQTLQYQIVMG